MSVRNLSRIQPPRLSWEKIKNKILSSRYSLSLVFLSRKRMAELNRKYRKKSGPTNILAFPLEKFSGEIFIDLSVAGKEAKERGVSFRKYVLYLFVHALLHLKGLRHHTKRARAHMEQLEQKWLNILP
ncbi:rRNA maturation RNase YbeY [Patescibacteria group bacterium]|nr:rRNA maturation RNase YbeY [Patescibacteria group bacterium]